MWFPVHRRQTIIYYHLFTDVLLGFSLQSQTNGADVEFTCQHGPNECYGNKVHACAIQHIQVIVEKCSFSSLKVYENNLIST